MNEKLAALVDMLNGALDQETEASAAQRARIEDEDKDLPADKRRVIAFGFVEGSPMWDAAQLVSWPLVAMQPQRAPDQADLFAPVEALPVRYDLDIDGWESVVPLGIEGERPAEAWKDDDADDVHCALAWDAEWIALGCMRGHICMLERKRWAEGYRQCSGC